jgi:hypothetical protein
LSANFEDIKKEVHGTVAVLRILLAFNYHLLTRHFVTQTAVYYTSSYGPKEDLRRARTDARVKAATFRSSFGRDGKRFVRECCAAWKLKPVKNGRRDLTAASSGRGRAAEAGR